MKHIRREFQDQLLNEIIEFKKYGKAIEHTTGESLIKKIIVIKLANNNIPFKVINLGAGLTKITTETNTGSKCNGTGKC